MKKILFVTNHLNFSNGVANVLLSLVNALDKEIYDITVMPLFICDEKFVKQFDKNIKIKTMFKKYFKGFSFLLSLVPQKILYKYIIKESYDIEIAFQAGLPTKMLASSTNVNAKHIAWMHGYDGGHTKFHEKFDKIICCAKSSSEQFKQIFKYPQRVDFLYNLVDDKVVVEKSKEVLSVQKKFDFTFCTVGRLSPEKGFLRLLQCHSKLLKEGFKHNLWIVGDGAEMDSLKKYVTDNNLEKSAILFGFDSNPFKYMANSDMFVCSSFNEGMSTVCVESMILGKSVLSTLVNGAKELISDKNCGIVVENSETALYDGMKCVLEHKDTLKEFENNIKTLDNLLHKDRLKNIESFFGDL